jgi:hypothetical protein
VREVVLGRPHLGGLNSDRGRLRLGGSHRGLRLGAGDGVLRVLRLTLGQGLIRLLCARNGLRTRLRKRGLRADQSGLGGVEVCTIGVHGALGDVALAEQAGIARHGHLREDERTLRFTDVRPRGNDRLRLRGSIRPRNVDVLERRIRGGALDTDPGIRPNGVGRTLA